MEITGKLIAKLPPVTGEGKNGQWKKQNFVVETISDFPKKICFVVWQDKADLNSFVESDIVRVYFDIESREYNGNWFTDLKCWKIELDKPGTGEQYQPLDSLDSQNINIIDINLKDDPGDDLPF